MVASSVIGDRTAAKANAAVPSSGFEVGQRQLLPGSWLFPPQAVWGFLQNT